MKRGLLIPLVASLFVLSFIESWAALLDAARATGIPYPEPWPWMVDGFIVATALLVVEARRTGHGAGVWWPRLGLLGATALSTGIQATWAPQEHWAWALHAWSPLAVLCSFECLVWLVFTPGQARPQRASGPPAPARLRRWLRSWEDIEAVGSVRASTAGPGEDPGPTVPVPGSRERQPVAPVPRGANGLTATQRRRVEGWVGEGRTNKSWMARELGLSDRAKKERLAPLVDQLAAQQNGDGP